MAETLLQPVSRRPWVRTFTVRDHRPHLQELDIEFALHGDQGPASAWAASARPGDPAGIFEEGYSYLPPAGADRQLLVGDESALPAILSILATATAALTGDAFLEADIRSHITCPTGVRVRWLPREGTGTIPGALALDAVRNAPDLYPPSYTWVAGEAKLATGVRRHLINERHIDRERDPFVLVDAGEVFGQHGDVPASHRLPRSARPDQLRCRCSARTTNLQPCQWTRSAVRPRSGTAW